MPVPKKESPGNTGYIFFDLFYLVKHLLCFRLTGFCFPEEIFCSTELTLVHKDLAHAQVGDSFAFFIGNTRVNGGTDISFAVFKIALLS